MSFEFAKKLYSEKKYKKAIEQYQIAITNKENMCDSFYGIGCCYIKLKDYKEAKVWFKKANGIKLLNRNFYNLGFCCSVLNDIGGALYNFLLANKLDEYDEDTIDAIEKCINKICESKDII